MQQTIKRNRVDLKNKILIIEDDKSILDAITMMLTYCGYGVVPSEQTTIADTLKNDKKNLPSLIILDILLSGKDGRDICKKLKQNPVTKHIPIIMMSAHPNAEKTVQAAGANEFIAKPFEIDELLTKVKKYLHY